MQHFACMSLCEILMDRWWKKDCLEMNSLRTRMEMEEEGRNNGEQTFKYRQCSIYSPTYEDIYTFCDYLPLQVFV